MLVRKLEMKIRYTCGAFMALLLLLNSSLAVAQTLHRFGQSIQPIYEGFERNNDGSFTMWFGYLNRNYDEKPTIEIGDNNAFYAADGVNTAGPLDRSLLLSNPGAQDRGQPTYFYPRRQQFVFGVTLPADFIGNELIWSVTHNGETRTAVGTLERENIWAIDEGVWSANRGRGTGGRTEVEYANQRPAVRLVGIEGAVSAQVGQAINLRAFAADDGVPGPYERERRGRMDQLPNRLPEVGGGIGRNSPKEQDVVNYAAADKTGLAVTWIKYRGPGQVFIDNDVAELDPAGEEVVATATFSQSGTYILRAYADDSTYTTYSEVTVTVR
ncbi:MAG: hypothetical protein OXU66_09000 [Gammaproteobacteria bacterium]|nr:hypothetical protein [Gammaproteobacteria bacterium]MDD9959068.1 hypothetical protein [Gammaproteobacteria bacterium]